VNRFTPVVLIVVGLSLLLTPIATAVQIRSIAAAHAGRPAVPAPASRMCPDGSLTGGRW
jgi:hypothetical protein